MTIGSLAFGPLLSYRDGVIVDEDREGGDASPKKSLTIVGKEGCKG
jgi:hypothetical protein